MHFFLWLAMMTKSIRVRIPNFSLPWRVCAPTLENFFKNYPENGMPPPKFFCGGGQQIVTPSISTYIFE